MQFITSNIDLMFRWLTFAAILLPLLGGVAGWGAWKLGDRISDRDKAQSEEVRKEDQKKIALLEDKLAPRIITSDQREKFLKFAANAPKCSVYIRSIQSDSEAAAYADMIQSLLTEAGYEVKGRGNHRDTFLGIRFECRPPSETPLSLNGFELLKVFMSSGFDTGPTWRGDYGNTSEDVSISIGGRPK